MPTTYPVNTEEERNTQMIMNRTRSTTLVDQARKEWRFEITYWPARREWTVRSLDEGWTHVVKPSFLRGFPTARNIAITAVFEHDDGCANPCADIQENIPQSVTK